MSYNNIEKQSLWQILNSLTNKFSLDKNKMRIKKPILLVQSIQDPKP